MSMTTELIDKLRGQASLLDEVDNLAIKAVKNSLIEAADVIEELSAKLHASQMERSSQYYHGGWISVDERLPEDGKYVLLQSPLNTLFFGYYCEEKRTFSDRVHCKYTNLVKYWRPLPEAYRGEDAK